MLVKNALIYVYGKHGDGKVAKKMFSKMKDKKIVGWNALITSYVKTSLCDEVLAIL